MLAVLYCRHTVLMMAAESILTKRQLTKITSDLGFLLCKPFSFHIHRVAKLHQNRSKGVFTDTRHAAIRSSLQIILACVNAI